MKKKQHYLYLILLFLITLFPLSGCSSGSSPGQPVKDSSTESTEKKTTSRETYTDVYTPEASQTTVYEDGAASLDASHTKNGYIMVRYSGEVPKVKLQVTIPDSTVYTYTLDTDSYGSYETFPLSGSNGTYQVDLYENVTDDKYALIFSQSLDVTLQDEFQPYLYPNQYVWFTKDSQVVKKGQALSDDSADDLDYVQQVYHYVIENITYDEQKADTVASGYIPDPDATMQEGKGICFDYASLMTALLRSQHIPTKLEVGYSGEAYHAWISVYLDEVGWVDNIIEFDGKDWSLMDPTLAASNSASSVKKYIGDGSNYTVKYSY